MMQELLDLPHVSPEVRQRAAAVLRQIVEEGDWQTASARLREYAARVRNNHPDLPPWEARDYASLLEAIAATLEA